MGVDGDGIAASFGGWRGPIEDLVPHLRDPIRHALFVVPRLPTYVDGDVALLGDAAHAMTPDLGRGACEALVDAVALADALRDADSVRAGLAAYDRIRRRPTQRVARMAAAASWLTTWRRALPVRDAILRLSASLPTPD